MSRSKKDGRMPRVLRPHTVALASFMVAATGSNASAGEDGISAEFSGIIDMRAAVSSDEVSWLEHGLGKTRYGSDGGDSRLIPSLADASLVANIDFGWAFDAFAHIQYSPEQEVPIDIVEAFLRYKPVPPSANRYRAKLGMFFPPVSLEHTGTAWTSPYSITPSAINSWIGEEVKSTGLEASVSRRMNDHTVEVTGSVFAANDLAGTLLTWRGWAMHDVKLTAFGHFTLPPIPSLTATGPFGSRGQKQWVEPSRELDDAVGYYTAAKWSRQGTIEVTGIFYDNLGDPEIFDGDQYAWDTRFWNLGVRANLPYNLELLAQYMDGTTIMGPAFGGTRVVDVGFKSHYILLSKKISDLRLSLRYDEFSTQDNGLVVSDNNNEDGWALMGALSIDFQNDRRVIFEVLRIDSTRQEREDIGFDVSAVETQLQASYRFYF